MEKGVWRFEIALGLFFYIFFWRQPLEKGVWRCEVALGLFFDFFGWQAFGKGSFSLINVY